MNVNASDFVVLPHSVEIIDTKPKLWPLTIGLLLLNVLLFVGYLFLLVDRSEKALEIRSLRTLTESQGKTIAAMESVMAMEPKAVLRETKAVREERRDAKPFVFDLLQEEQKLLETRGENHPDIKAIRKRIQIAKEYAK